MFYFLIFQCRVFSVLCSPGFSSIYLKRFTIHFSICFVLGSRLRVLADYPALSVAGLHGPFKRRADRENKQKNKDEHLDGEMKRMESVNRFVEWTIASCKLPLEIDLVVSFNIYFFFSLILTAEIPTGGEILNMFVIIMCKNSYRIVSAFRYKTRWKLLSFFSLISWNTLCKSKCALSKTTKYFCLSTAELEEDTKIFGNRMFDSRTPMVSHDLFSRMSPIYGWLISLKLSI